MNTTATAAASYTMADMVRAHVQGNETRDRIVKEVRRNHRAGGPPLTGSEIARRLGINQSTASRQTAHLVASGELLRVEVAVGIFAFVLPDAQG